MVRGLRRGSRLRARCFKIAAACVPAFRDNFAIAHEHGSYERIGIRESRAAARELNSSAHVFDIGFAVCHGCLLLMPRIRAFAEGRRLRLAISAMRALMRMMSKSVANQLAWVWSGWAMDARRRSALASPNSRNPANAKSPETRTFQGLQMHWCAACCRVVQSSFIQTVLSASEFHRINLAVRGL